jgi:hypothetical protein
MLHEPEVWLAQNPAEIGARSDEGNADAQRGELIDADAAGSRLGELHYEESA